MSTVIRVENLSKSYRLGQISGGTLSEDLNRWWARARGRPDPYLKIGQADHGNRRGEYIWALKDVSFQVQQGEVLGIIGRNGAGKSTLLKILSRVTAPTSGLVKVKGRIASLLEVGTGFHPDLTGRENIYLNGAILGMRRDEVRRKFDEIVAFAEIEKFIDTPVKRYSSGMYVRLAFAVAAHLDPEILVVDEVLAVGDATFQKKCLGKMGDVAKMGRTILFVSHNLTAVENLCPKTLLLRQGRAEYLGETPESIAHYLNVGREKWYPSEIDLSRHPGRRKECKPVIRGLKIASDDRIQGNIVSIGNKVDFEFSLDPGDTRYSNCALGLGIFSIYGQLIVPFKSKIQFPNKWSLANPKSVTLTWRECNISPGIYKVNVAFSSDDKIVDWIDDVIEIEVRIKGDLELGSGLLDSSGIVVPDASWTI